MRLKTGAVTPREKVFVERYAATGDAHYAAEKAGYKQVAVAASEQSRNPRLAPMIREAQLARLNEEGPVIVVDTMFEVAQDKRQTGAARIKAATEIGKLCGMYQTGEGEFKDPAEMTPDQLFKARDIVVRKINELTEAAKVIEGESTPVAQDAPTIFD